jgi:hypothetical protein
MTKDLPLALLKVSEGMIGLGGTFTEPYPYLDRGRVDISHHSNLLVSLFFVRLIDTDRIDPDRKWRARFPLGSEMS